MGFCLIYINLCVYTHRDTTIALSLMKTELHSSQNTVSVTYKTMSKYYVFISKKRLNTHEKFIVLLNNYKNMLSLRKSTLISKMKMLIEIWQTKSLRIGLFPYIVPPLFYMPQFLIHTSPNMTPRLSCIPIRSPQGCSIICLINEHHL